MRTDTRNEGGLEWRQRWSSWPPRAEVILHAHEHVHGHAHVHGHVHMHAHVHAHALLIYIIFIKYSTIYILL